ncbi:MAG: hypothetical protein HYU56_04065 [Candidatus Aenigmarchaeota archaeon]|nr:hypothetical protein [Candidatus Aenigmarchaeota archaeon]
MWFTLGQNIGLAILLISVIVIAGCISNSNYNSNTQTIKQNENLRYDNDGVSLDLKEKTTLPYLESINSIDCSNPNNYNRSSIGHGFYLNSKWIPSTKEGTFDTIVESVVNTGCTNLYTRYLTYIVFNSSVIKKYDSGCYPNAEPLRPTKGFAHAGVFLWTENLVVNQTGQYLVQIDIMDCIANETLSKKAVIVDMGNINSEYYNRVDSSNSINIS